jgi:hypothetical protein
MCREIIAGQYKQEEHCWIERAGRSMLDRMSRKISIGKREGRSALDIMSRRIYVGQMSWKITVGQNEHED